MVDVNGEARPDFSTWTDGLPDRKTAIGYVYDSEHGGFAIARFWVEDTGSIIRREDVFPKRYGDKVDADLLARHYADQEGILALGEVTQFETPITLDKWTCPACGNTGEYGFRVEGNAVFDITGGVKVDRFEGAWDAWSTGTNAGDYADLAWDAHSSNGCGCGFMGTVADFILRTPSQVTKQVTANG